MKRLILKLKIGFWKSPTEYFLLAAVIFAICLKFHVPIRKMLNIYLKGEPFTAILIAGSNFTEAERNRVCGESYSCRHIDPRYEHLGD